MEILRQDLRRTRKLDAHTSNQAAKVQSLAQQVHTGEQQRVLALQQENSSLAAEV